MIRSFFGRPLVQFFAVGLLLYGAAGFFDRARGDDITVSRSEISRLSSAWAASNNDNAPTNEQLDVLINALVREEILVREARRRGLESGDVIVRRRLAQKMTFLIEDNEAPKMASEDEISAYFRANRRQYDRPARFDFSHIYFSRDRRGARVQADALAALQSLQSGEVVSGDPFIQPLRYTQITNLDADRIFGDGFAARLDPAAQGWQGPVRSAFGVHLVKTSDLTQARAPELGEVRQAVIRDIMDVRRRAANEAAYEKIASRYSVTIENTDPKSGQETGAR